MKVPAAQCSDESGGGGGRFIWMLFLLRMAKAASGYGLVRSDTSISLLTIMDLIWSSSTIWMPRLCASRTFFGPGVVPITRKLVIFENTEVTFPPCFSMMAFTASFPAVRPSPPNPSHVPVSKKRCPSNLLLGAVTLPGEMGFSRWPRQVGPGVLWGESSEATLTPTWQARFCRSGGSRSEPCVSTYSCNIF
jgi:hypothetical protein